MSAVLLVSALLMGLLGSTHCVVMCGGVVAMTCSALPLARRVRPLAQLPYMLAYNAGRIASYAVAGADGGRLGAALASFGVVARAQLGLRVAAGALMIAVGLYVAGSGARAPLGRERAGEPSGGASRRSRGASSRSEPPQALALGLLWGWMPCGLVYAALAAAVTSGSAAGGAATMAAFGLGTLPMLVAMGSAAALVARAARSARCGWSRALRSSRSASSISAGAGYAWAAVRKGGPPTCCVGHRHAGEPFELERGPRGFARARRPCWSVASGWWRIPAETRDTQRRTALRAGLANGLHGIAE